MENNSGKSMQFGFNKSDAENKEQKIDNDNLPVEETQSVAETDTSNEDVNEEYTDRRSITVSLVKSYSLYRKKNDKSLPKRKDYIGGSVRASRTLSSNKEEVETYFPNIIGLSPNDPNFISRVKQYLNNIRIPVDELGRSFDISFHYFHKKIITKLKQKKIKLKKFINLPIDKILNLLKKLLMKRLISFTFLKVQNVELVILLTLMII